MTDFAFNQEQTISYDQLRSSTPAVFADAPFTATSPSYKFIATHTLVEALFNAGFRVTAARQTQARGERAGFTRHLLRFRQIRETVQLADAIPEIVLINSHDATSAYQLRAGLYRPVCANGMLARLGDFGVIHVPHRGNIIANVVDAALTLTSGFSRIGDVIDQMVRTALSSSERFDFAARALAIRFSSSKHVPISPDDALLARRTIDVGADVWHTYNVVQENLLRGGIQGKTARGRSTCTRGINAIREDVRINNELWQLAMTMLRS